MIHSDHLELWNQMESKKGSFLHTLQKTLQRWTAVAAPIIHGRGIFQYDIGIMPHRHPIVLVIGDPIPCPKNKNPSQELLQEYQEKYLEGLKQIYDKHKDRFAKGRKSEIHFIE
jgi:2-acylglycerol O-acyltransferase 2